MVKNTTSRVGTRSLGVNSPLYFSALRRNCFSTETLVEDLVID
jgi:hypothetical protein